MKLLLCSLILIATTALADTTPEYYWGMSTEIAQKNVDHISTELIMGSRTYDAEKKVLTDEQVALSNENSVRPQTYRFDLKAKTLEVLVEGKKIGEGKVVSSKLSDQNEVLSLAYNYVTQGESSYSYTGNDRLLHGRFPTLKVNQENGTVIAQGKKYQFSITYYPISKEKYFELRNRIFKSGAAPSIAPTASALPAK